MEISGVLLDDETLKNPHNKSEKKRKLVFDGYFFLGFINEATNIYIKINQKELFLDNMNKKIDR